MITKSGEIKECETTSTFIEYGGQMVSFYTAHDITENKRMQTELRKSEEKYRALIDKATDGILITQNGVFKFVNPAFCEMMQYTENELINKPFIEVVAKEHHAEMLENHKRRMNGESFPAIYRAKLYRKDGSDIIVELISKGILHRLSLPETLPIVCKKKKNCVWLRRSSKT
jgi:PAS domain S-box-containing protein